MLDFWREEFMTQARIEQPEDFPLVIVGNKKDLVKPKVADDPNPQHTVTLIRNTQIDPEEADQWCQSRGNVVYLETSCLDRNSLEKAFTVIARKSAPPDHSIPGQQDEK
jgi:Ras-related protein Rab-7A